MVAQPISVPIVRLRPSELPVPKYQTEGAAGMDLVADINEPVVLASLERRLIPTGVAVALPRGYEAQIRPRSGLALKQGITCLNAPGTIDSDYRGEICALLVNLSHIPATISRGDRIAQLVVAGHALVAWNEVASLEATARGSGGFGSTGSGS